MLMCCVEGYEPIRLLGAINLKPLLLRIAGGEASSVLLHCNGSTWLFVNRRFVFHVLLADSICRCGCLDNFMRALNTCNCTHSNYLLLSDCLAALG